MDLEMMLTGVTVALALSVAAFIYMVVAGNFRNNKRLLESPPPPSPAEKDAEKWEKGVSLEEAGKRVSSLPPPPPPPPIGKL